MRSFAALVPNGSFRSDGRLAAAGARAMLAPVSVASVEDSFDGVTVTPLCRGHGLVVRFTGLRNAEADPALSR